MLTTETILANATIADFLKTHEGASEDIKNAAEQLKNQDDAIPALVRLLPALSKKELPVFFSYKTENEKAAREIVGALRSHSGGKLKITYQAEFEEQIAGQNWYDSIRASIREANWFILLLPVSHYDWDWPLFETGLFEAQRTSADRLICLHHPASEVPDQIGHYEAITAKTLDVENFLRGFFVDSGPVPGMGPINKYIEGHDLRATAKKIVDAINVPQQTLHLQILEPWLRLKIADITDSSSSECLENAAVDANVDALRIFGLLEQPKTWKDICSAIPESKAHNIWREQFFNAIKEIRAGHVPDTLQCVIHAKSGTMYRPVIYGIDRLGGEHGVIDALQIVFAEEISTVDFSEMPKDLLTLATLLRFTFRFRWEVLEIYTKGTLTENDVVCIDAAFDRMEKEWQERGGGGRSDIEKLFSDSEKDAKDLSEIFDEWDKIRNCNGTGQLDKAIELKDPNKVQDLLRSIMPINQKFLLMAADRFSQLIRDYS